MQLEISHRSPLCDSHREEVASLVTHAAGVVFSIAALVTMLFLAYGEPLKVVSAAVFGTSLILLYLSSTLYHFFTSARWKAHFQSLDHACIYLLIAGSYTLGIVFYAWHRLPFNHAMWHRFVLGGSMCHVLAVSRYVLF